MIRKILSVIVCVIVVVSSLSFTSFATDEIEFERPIINITPEDTISMVKGEDLLDMGYVYDEVDGSFSVDEENYIDLYAAPNGDASAPTFSAKYQNGFNYFNNYFDLSLIPSNIQKIIYDKDSAVLLNFLNDYYFEIYVMYGVQLCYCTNDGASKGRGYLFAYTGVEDYCLYFARYRLQGPSTTWAIDMPWEYKAPVTVDNMNEKWQYYNDCVFLADNATDIYAYGMNSYKYPDSVIVSIGPSTNTGVETVFHFYPGMYSSTASKYNQSFSNLDSTIRLKGMETFPTSEQFAEKTQKSILSYIKDLPSNTMRSFSTLFTNLANKISGFFDNLSSSIGGFFTTLKNWLLWFNAEGEASYTNPFENITTKVYDFIESQIEDTEEFQENMDTYINSMLANSSKLLSVCGTFIDSVPLLSVFFVAFVAFFVMRKAVGR